MSRHVSRFPTMCHENRDKAPVTASCARAASGGRDTVTPRDSSHGSGVTPQRISAVASPERTALYRHFDGAGQLLYVGISLCALQRLVQHKANASWFKRIARVEIQWCESREYALQAERQAIESEYPEFNAQWNHGRRAVDSAGPVAWGIYHHASRRFDGWYFKRVDAEEMLRFFASTYPAEEFNLVTRNAGQPASLGLLSLRPHESHLWALGPDKTGPWSRAHARFAEVA